MTVAFEADLAPDTGAPRVRMNFINGWSVSLVLAMPDKGRTRFALASVAAAPTGHWGTGRAELLSNEAFADEVANFLADIASRPVFAGIGGRA